MALWYVIAFILKLLGKQNILCLCRLIACLVVGGWINSIYFIKKIVQDICFQVRYLNINHFTWGNFNLFIRK